MCVCVCVCVCDDTLKNTRMCDSVIKDDKHDVSTAGVCVCVCVCMMYMCMRVCVCVCVEEIVSIR